MELQLHDISATLHLLRTLARPCMIPELEGKARSSREGFPLERSADWIQASSFTVNRIMGGCQPRASKAG